MHFDENHRVKHWEKNKCDVEKKTENKNAGEFDPCSMHEFIFLFSSEFSLSTHKMQG